MFTWVVTAPLASCWTQPKREYVWYRGPELGLIFIPAQLGLCCADAVSRGLPAGPQPPARPVPDVTAVAKETLPSPAGQI